MEKPLGKLIDIPRDDNILRDLKILAAKAEQELKPFIEDSLVELVKTARKNKEV